MARSAAGDLIVPHYFSLFRANRRKQLEDRGIQVLVFDGPGGRVDFPVAPWNCGRAASTRR